MRFKLSTKRLVEVLELRVAIRMLRTFEALAIGLQTVAQPLSNRATIFMLVGCPCCVSAATRLRWLRAVQSSGDSGSPRVV